MGKLTTFKRELRALYKPKPRDSEVENKQNTHVAIELDSRDSTQSRPHSACEEPLPCAYVSGQVHAHSPSDHEDVDDSETGSTPRPKNAPLQETEVRVSDPKDTSRQTLDVEEAEQEGTELQDPEPDEVDASAVDASDEPLTFEEAEAVRETTYIAFSIEAPEDYTSGPPRFVFASDGLQDCGALLMTFEFSQRVQTAIAKQRNFEVMKSQGLLQRWALTRLATKVQGAIASCNTQLVRLEDLEGEEHQEQRQALQQRATVLEAMLLDVGNAGTISHSISNQTSQLRDSNGSYDTEIGCSARQLQPDSSHECMAVKKGAGTSGCHVRTLDTVLIQPQWHREE